VLIPEFARGRSRHGWRRPQRRREGRPWLRRTIRPLPYGAIAGSFIKAAGRGAAHQPAPETLIAGQRIERTRAGNFFGQQALEHFELFELTRIHIGNEALPKSERKQRGRRRDSDQHDGGEDQKGLVNQTHGGDLSGGDLAS
jgi:hypothetical protein